jgi:hypothetical protein
MSFPQDEGEFYLDTDASDTAIGAVLSQVQDGQMNVISYGPKCQKQIVFLTTGQFCP